MAEPIDDSLNLLECRKTEITKLVMPTKLLHTDVVFCQLIFDVGDRKIMIELFGLFFEYLGNAIFVNFIQLTIGSYVCRNGECGNVAARVAQKASQTSVPAVQAQGSQTSAVRLTKNMSIADMVKAMEPEIKRALPSVLTPERFTRMALSALNNTPKLAECTPMSFLAALMNAAQLGAEIGPLGMAYLIPVKNRGIFECQFQLGYKGLIDLAYRNEHMQSIEAHTIYANDEFHYELGLDPMLKHVPAWENRGEIIGFYAVYKLDNGGVQFEVMSKADIDRYAATFSKAFSSDYSPWKTNYESMAKKTVIKQLLKYAPIKSDFRKAISMDETIKTELSVDMSEVRNEDVEHVEIPTNSAEAANG